MASEGAENEQPLDALAAQDPDDESIPEEIFTAPPSAASGEATPAGEPGQPAEAALAATPAAPAPIEEPKQEPGAPAAQDQEGAPCDSTLPPEPAAAETSAGPAPTQQSPQRLKPEDDILKRYLERTEKMKAQEIQYRQRLREIAKKKSAMSDLHNSVPSFEARVRKRHQEKTEKMRALETEYRVKLNGIAQKDSVLKLPDNPLPSFEARVQTRTHTGMKKLASSDADYKAWLQQRTVLHGDRVTKVTSDRSASVADMRAKAGAQRQQQRAADIKLVGTLFYGVPHGTPPRPSHSWSEPQLGSTLSPEEKQRILDKLANPIWEKSLEERAQAERGYWRWASQLKAQTQCAVDHHFHGPMGMQTDTQRELIEKAATEKEYWKWAASLKSSKTCKIDQAWGLPGGAGHSSGKVVAFAPDSDEEHHLEEASDAMEAQLVAVER